MTAIREITSDDRGTEWTDEGGWVFSHVAGDQWVAQHPDHGDTRHCYSEPIGRQYKDGHLFCGVRKFTGNEWSPHIEAAAKAMYKRLRIADPERYPKWRHLGIDSFDHYCIAARNAVEAFTKSASADIEVEYS